MEDVMDIWMQLLLGITIIGFGAIIAFLWIIVGKYFFLKTKVNERFERMLNERVVELLQELIYKFDKLIPEFEDSEIKRAAIVVLYSEDGSVAMKSPKLVEELFDFANSKVQREYIPNMYSVRELVLEFCQLCRKCAIKINTLDWDEKLNVISSEDANFEEKFNNAVSMVNRLETYLD